MNDPKRAVSSDSVESACSGHTADLAAGRSLGPVPRIDGHPSIDFEVEDALSEIFSGIDVASTETEEVQGVVSGSLACKAELMPAPREEPMPVPHDKGELAEVEAAQAEVVNQSVAVVSQIPMENVNALLDKCVAIRLAFDSGGEFCEAVKIDLLDCRVDVALSVRHVDSNDADGIVMVVTQLEGEPYHEQEMVDGLLNAINAWLQDRSDCSNEGQYIEGVCGHLSRDGVSLVLYSREIDSYSDE